MVINVYVRLVVFSAFVSILEVLGKRGSCLNGGLNAKGKHLNKWMNIYVEYHKKVFLPIELIERQSCQKI